MLQLLAALVAGAVIGALAAGVLSRRRGRDRRRELEAARRRLESARAARQAFFDLTTHELRTPLSAILGYQELLHDGAYGDLGEEGRDAVQRLGRAARHLQNLIDGVMELARIRSGDLEPDLGDVDLGMVVAAAAEAFRTQASERGIEPGVHIDDGLPTVRSDQERAVRALDLVVTSAIRHPATRTMTLTATREPGRVAVSLEPTDFEIDTDIEDPAVRLGIRLAVARGIGELLGGGLDLEIRDGRARRITLRLGDPGARPEL